MDNDEKELQKIQTGKLEFLLDAAYKNKPTGCGPFIFHLFRAFIYVFYLFYKEYRYNNVFRRKHG
jgi:hypothetical protein